MVHRRQCAVHGVCEYVIDWSINAICRIETAPIAGLAGRHMGYQNGAGYRLTV